MLGLLIFMVVVGLSLISSLFLLHKANTEMNRALDRAFNTPKKR